MGENCQTRCTIQNPCLLQQDYFENYDLFDALLRSFGIDSDVPFILNWRVKLTQIEF